MAGIKPPDVPEWQEVVPLYETTTAENVALDASTNPPNHAALDLPDYPTSQTGRIVTFDAVAAGSYPLTTLDGGSGLEAKFRLHSNVTKILFDDPIRNYAEPGTSHGHQFFGNVNVNAYSTYESLRTNNSSFSSGAELNATAYWFPFVKLPNGRAHHAYVVLIYYVSDPSVARQLVRIPHGLRYVTGTDMDDPDRTWLQAYLDAANLAYGSTRYVLANPGNGLMSARPLWNCMGAIGPDGVTSSSRYLVDPVDGSDPWNGTCQAGQEFWMDLTGASCWDGINLWSPSGYRHVIPKVWDILYGKWVCPKNFFEIPSLTVKPEWKQLGPTDYMTWSLSSDAMANAAAGRNLGAGGSFHTDWFDGWDQTTKDEWHFNCLGAEGNTPHQCNDSVFGPTKKLISTEPAPNGRSPQVQCIGQACTEYFSNVDSDTFGTTTVHHGGADDVIEVGG